MNLAGVSEDFGPHSGSVVLLRLPDFFFYKKFFWTDFFQEQGTEFFCEPRKIFWQDFCLGFRMTERIFLSDALKDFSKNGKRFF